ncbi:MalY/PatB family protein [Microbacterium sp. SORGH_AS_0888]|uniref:MalY/PatB family protein n=1 Tax=Microbacterium sp. SORGH_AS_0888 TaxID=3041791 RepID=UPI002788DC19|nr:aminotransferase class I/II-fold pyridoxal phosphate-dependent enzyme [Microbacterium sp. SORGH_AS_0888]MDQ1128424.1 cystathionine beta-lyase [Microbacterium sp. SORGH_AS_0888]
MPQPLQALPLEELRRRRSVKWRAYPEDVLPLFVAETDFPLAPAVHDVLAEAVARGDTGYTPSDPGIRAAYAGFAARRFGWDVDARRIRSTGDVMMGVVELLRRLTRPGDRVVVTPPVYPPFFDCVAEAGAETVSVPLVGLDDAPALDLAGIERAFAAGARALLLCNPHNPTGTVHAQTVLRELADIAHRHGAVVISDEIHAPLAGRDFTPFLSASEIAARVGYAVTSASKAFNLAGLKCALIITADDATTAVVSSLPDEVEWRTGLFGALAGTAAFSPASDEWLDRLRAAITANHALLADLLADRIPGARFRIPDAGYLAWVDLSALGWGDDPATRILREGRVALHHGPRFGPGGEGHVRINVGCAPEVLTEAVRRIEVLVR